MASYRIEWKQSARKELRQLGRDIIPRVVKTVEALADDPHPAHCRKLKDSEHLYRVRAGDYRIVYSVHASPLVIEIIRIRHRRDVYRQLR